MHIRCPQSCNSFNCHTSENSPVSPVIATLPSPPEVFTINTPNLLPANISTRSLPSPYPLSFNTLPHPQRHPLNSFLINRFRHFLGRDGGCVYRLAASQNAPPISLERQIRHFRIFGWDLHARRLIRI